MTPVTFSAEGAQPEEFGVCAGVGEDCGEKVRLRADVGRDGEFFVGHRCGRPRWFLQAAAESGIPHRHLDNAAITPYTDT
jgi:hypothetical protein